MDISKHKAMFKHHHTWWNKSFDQLTSQWTKVQKGNFTGRGYFFLALFLCFLSPVYERSYKTSWNIPGGLRNFLSHLKNQKNLPNKNLWNKMLKVPNSILPAGHNILNIIRNLCSLAYSSALLWLAHIIDSVLGKELLLHLFLLH